MDWEVVREVVREKGEEKEVAWEGRVKGEGDWEEGGEVVREGGEVKEDSGGGKGGGMGEGEEGGLEVKGEVKEGDWEEMATEAVVARRRVLSHLLCPR